MDEILGELREEGHLDSQGHFTVSLQEAMRKLAERQFELPGLYLLKLIQACVALKARQIAIKIGVDTVSFEADLEDSPVSPESVERLLQGPFQPFATSWERHLAWAWTACVAVEPQRVELLAGNRRLEWSAGRASVEPAGDRRLSLRCWKKGVHWWQRLLPLRTAEHALVCRAAGFCPIPLKVDGFWVDGSEPRPGTWKRGKPEVATTGFWQPVTLDYPIGQRLLFRKGGRLSARPPLLVEPGSVEMSGREIVTVGLNYPGRPLVYSWKWPGEVEPIHLQGTVGEELRQLDQAYLLGFNSGLEGGRYYNLDQIAFLAVPQAVAEEFLCSSERRITHSLPMIGPGLLFDKFFRMPLQQRVPLCWAQLWLPADQPAGTGWVFPCQHGVLLDPVLTDLGHPGTVAVVTADELETDLSQLKVVQDARWEALVADLRQEVHHFRAQLIGSKGVALLADIDYPVMTHIQRKLSS